MTNEAIVEKARQRLINEGAIAPSELIHTYARWKELGFQVKKGEKAIAQFVIWKYAEKTVKEETPEEITDKKIASLFTKKASFFSEKQVSIIEK